MAMVPRETAEQRLERLSAPPPPTFNADYARLQLELERDRPRTAGDRFAIVIALITSAVGAAVAAFNVATYWSDRSARAEQQVFEDRVKVATIYFERLGPLQSDAWCKQSKVFSDTTLAVAKMTEKDVPAEGTGRTLTGVQAVAVALVQEAARRSSKEGCDANLQTRPASSGQVAGKLDVASPAVSQTSRYSFEQASVPTGAPAPAGAHYQVYIQYLVSSDDAHKRAEAIRKAMPSADGFSAPGIEGVRQVPSQDQIRIYWSSDAAAAEQLRQKLPLPNAQIIDLASAYKNLPHGRMEIWIGQSPDG